MISLEEGYLSFEGVSKIAESLKVVSHDYSGLLSAVFAFFMLLVTIVYVVFTHKQVKATHDASANSARPLLVVDVSKASVVESLTERGGHMLTVRAKVRNIGVDPALNVFCFAKIIPQHSGVGDICANQNAEYIPFIEAGGTADVYFGFFERATNAFVEDMELSFEKNIRRLCENPSESHAPGSGFVIDCYYCNAFSAYQKTSFATEFAWLVPRCINDLPKSNNLNQYTVPPNKFVDDWSYDVLRVSSRFSPCSYAASTKEELYARIEADGDLPTFFVQNKPDC